MKGYLIKQDKKRKFYLQDFFRNHLNPKRFVLLILFILFICGIVLYSKIEGESYFRSMYWLITTITTVGYGDSTPISFQGQILAMVMMVLGVLTIGFLASEILSSIVSTNLGSLLGVNRVKGRVDYLICGWNEISNAALKELQENKHRIVIVDTERREELSKLDNVNFIKGSPMDKAILEKSNIKDTGSVILAMNNDSDVILAIHVIRELNPYVNIVAKINNHDDILLAKNAGADHIVGPAVIGGKLLWESYAQPTVSDWLVNTISAETAFGFYEYDVTSESTIIGKKLKDIKKIISGKAKVIGIDTVTGLEKIPVDDYTIVEGNKLILIVNKARFGGF